MSLSRGQLDQMEAAAIHKMKLKDELAALKAQIARGELVKVVRCRDCRHAALYGTGSCFCPIDCRDHTENYFCGEAKRREEK